MAYIFAASRFSGSVMIAMFKRECLASTPSRVSHHGLQITYVYNTCALTIHTFAIQQPGIFLYLSMMNV